MKKSIIQEPYEIDEVRFEFNGTGPYVEFKIDEAIRIWKNKNKSVDELFKNNSMMENLIFSKVRKYIIDNWNSAIPATVKDLVN